jgi:hypothetical protein
LLLKPPNFSSAKPPRPSKARSSNSRSSTCKATGTVKSGRISKVAGSGCNEEMPHVLGEADSPINCVKTTSPNGKRVSPPHHALSISPNRKGGRKLRLKSIPSFPSLTGDANSSSAISNTDSELSTPPLALGNQSIFIIISVDSTDIMNVILKLMAVSYSSPCPLNQDHLKAEK